MLKVEHEFVRLLRWWRKGRRQKYCSERRELFVATELASPESQRRNSGLVRLGTVDLDCQEYGVKGGKTGSYYRF